MKRKILTASLLVIAGLLSLALRENSEFTRNGTAMNTLIRMTVYGNDESVLDDSFALLSSLDKKLSMYDPSSDISIINKNSGVREVPASPERIETIKDSVRLYEITGGVFNPLIGAVTRLWKITLSGKPRHCRETLRHSEFNRLRRKCLSQRKRLCPRFRRYRQRLCLHENFKAHEG